MQQGCDKLEVCKGGMTNKCLNDEKFLKKRLRRSGYPIAMPTS
jgi:hypothetical protein